MFRFRNLLAIMVVNAVLLILFSFASEYFELSEKIQSVQYTVHTAVETALQTSTMSDDFYANGVHYGSAMDESGRQNTTSTDLVLWSTSENKFIRVNLMQAAMQYDANGGVLPDSELSPPDNNMTTIENMYNWSYVNNSYFNSTFRPFVANKGLTTKVWVSTPASGFSEVNNVPVLDQMGYGVNNPLLQGDEVFTHIWKTGFGGSYLYTPNSLGVTYINPKIFIPVLKANMEMLMRLKYTNPADGTGCIPAFWGRSHNVGGTEQIINNGVFELDLNSINANIEYKVINMFDANNDKILEYLFGADHTGFASKAAQLQSRATGGSSSNIVVAKVRVNMTIHIPFQSPWMQQGRFQFQADNDGNNHFDIVDTSATPHANNGVPYVYETYFTVAR